ATTHASHRLELELEGVYDLRNFLHPTPLAALLLIIAWLTLLGHSRGSGKTAPKAEVSGNGHPVSCARKSLGLRLPGRRAICWAFTPSSVTAGFGDQM